MGTAAMVLAAVPATLESQNSAPLTGRQLYTAACANCHGSDGRGAPDSVVGFADPPRPDFTDCSFASREAAADWSAIVHEGGPVRAFARRMPAFGKALSREQIELVVSYVLDLCRDKSWPRGELNLPRATATEKAFPEDETVLTANAITSRGSREVMSTLIYERRIGSQTQWELAIPFGVRERQPGRWTGLELGDIALAIKRAVIHRNAPLYIAVRTGTSSAQGLKRCSLRGACRVDSDQARRSSNHLCSRQRHCRETRSSSFMAGLSFG
jgi:mono/diheme cytochrome c family protein